MKKHIILLLLFTAATFAQNSKPVAEITTEGSASKQIKPDIIKLAINVSKEATTEKDALKQLTDEMNQLESFFAKTGIPKASVKISSYAIDKSYGDDDKKKYKALAGLQVAFKLDNKLLDAFYGELQAGNYKDVYVDYETSLSGELQKKVNAELVDIAIADAKQKAEAIAKSLGVKIVGISHVSKYGRELISVVDELKFRTLGRAAMDASAPAPPTVFSKYEVQDITQEEQITIVFEISNK